MIDPTKVEMKVLGDPILAVEDMDRKQGLAGLAPVLNKTPNLPFKAGEHNSEPNESKSAVAVSVLEQIDVGLGKGGASVIARDSLAARGLDIRQMDMQQSPSETGIERQDFYIGDRLIATRYIDVSDTALWSDITNFYDDAGQRVEKLTYFKDARQRIDIFENGERVTTTITDMSQNLARDWTTIVYDFNAAGQKTERKVKYDDGSTRKEMYSNGSLTALERTDVDPELWDSVTQTFTPNGLPLTRAVDFTDGVSRDEFYMAGKISFVTEMDRADQYDWHFLMWTYGATGDINRLETTFDTGDISVMSYENGARVSRIELDADGDQTWDYRVTYYENETVSDVVMYLDGDEFDWRAGGAGSPDQPLLNLVEASSDTGMLI